MKETNCYISISDIAELTFGTMKNQYKHNARTYGFARFRICDGDMVTAPEWIEGYEILKNYVPGTTLRIEWGQYKSKSGRVYNDVQAIRLNGGS